MSNPFKVGDEVVVITSNSSYKFKVGDEGIIVVVEKDFVGVNFYNLRDSDQDYLYPSLRDSRFQLLIRPEIISAFPVDVFDPRIFFEKETQEKMWESTTGSKWPYKD